MKGQVLARAIRQEVIASQHSFDDDGGYLGSITLPNEVLMTIQLADRARQPADLQKVLLAQVRMFFQFFYKDG
jgi:hypothetical protein